MVTMNLSIVIPFVNEWPQVAFTLRAISETLAGRLDFEVIAVDNWCAEVAEQTYELSVLLDNEEQVVRVRRTPDRGHDHYDKDGVMHTGHIKAVARKSPWLHYAAYKEKLSHWCAKRAGVDVSVGDAILFLDAHVVPTRDAIITQYHAFQQLREEFGDLVTAHLPLTYHILESHRLTYRLVDQRETGNISYSFCGCRKTPEPFEVACMSTCGMMISRALYDRIGGWPRELGVYGGGEHFMNFAGAVVGIRKFIVPNVTLHHHGEKRGYHWNYTDNARNRAIANYLFGGREYLDRYLANKKGRAEVLAYIRENVIQTCAEHRALIERQQVCTIDEWLDKWTSTPSESTVPSSSAAS